MTDFNDISDEMLAAYIDGNTTPEENGIIGQAAWDNDLFAEAVDIANDCAVLPEGVDAGFFGMDLSGMAGFADTDVASMADDRGLMDAMTGFFGTDMPGYTDHYDNGFHDFDDGMSSGHLHSDDLTGNGHAVAGDDMPFDDLTGSGGGMF